MSVVDATRRWPLCIGADEIAARDAEIARLNSLLPQDYATKHN